MIELDFIWMTLVIFVPSAFALALMLFPSPRDEAGKEKWNNAVRWWSLLGTAATLGISMGIFIKYYHNVYDHNISNPQDSVLGVRAEKARAELSSGVPDVARKS